VFFLSDGTATMDMNGVTALDLQRATCASLGQVFAQVLPVATMIEKIEEAAPQAERSSEVPVTAYRPLAEAATGSPTR
jgi:hypothetical protein